MNDGALDLRQLFRALRFVPLMMIQMLVDEHLMIVELDFLKDWICISDYIILF